MYVTQEPERWIRDVLGVHAVPGTCNKVKKKKKQIATTVHYNSKVVAYPLFALLSGSVGCGLGPAGATWQRRS